MIDCTKPVVENQVEAACTNAAKNFPCASEEPDYDERITVELPGTEWIFTCPEKKWLKSHTGMIVLYYLKNTHKLI